MMHARRNFYEARTSDPLRATKPGVDQIALRRGAPGETEARGRGATRRSSPPGTRCVLIARVRSSSSSMIGSKPKCAGAAEEPDRRGDPATAQSLGGVRVR